MSEYIGSQISLISKSDIKYVGILHEINSESSTVALENVRSYGTEDRRHGSEEVPPSDQVFAYIVFRGSDVKELSIVEAPKENKTPAPIPDPAIISSSRPPQFQQPPPPHHNQFPGPPYQQQPYDFQQGPYQQQPPPRFQPPGGGSHGFPNPPPNFNQGFQPPPYGMGYPPPQFGQHGPPPNAPYSPAQQPPQQPIAPPGQRPQKQEVQPRAQKPMAAEMSGTPVPPQQTAPPPPLESKPVNTAQVAAKQAAIPEQKPAARKAPNNRVAVPLAAAKAQVKPAPQVAAPQTYTDATEAATAAVARAMAELNPQNKPAVDDLAQKFNQVHVDAARGGFTGGGASGRGRGRGYGANRGVRRDQKPVDVPKEDFDFERANAKFNKQDLVKQAIAGGSPLASPTANGDENKTLERSGDGDIVIPPKPAEKGYDKQKSFFDDLSSDLKDRNATQAFDGRAMRREERNKNMDTFGQGSVDTGHRGGFRGRGRGRGRGYGRGAYNGGSNGQAQSRVPAA